MRRLLVCTLLSSAIIGCFAQTASRTQGPVTNKILEQFPGYHVLTVAERNYDAREFIRQHFRKGNPSIVQGDLDGNGHLDYAMLVKNDKAGTAKVVMLLCSGDAECKDVLDVDVSTNFGEVYLRPAPIGTQVSQTEAIDTKDYPTPVRLHSVGVEVSYFGKATVVYYWNKKTKKMEAVQTED